MERDDGGARIGGADESALSLASEWRRLDRFASIVAILIAPAVFVLAHDRLGWGLGWSILAAIAGIAIFRGAVDVLAHKLVPFPSLDGAEAQLREEDALARRRHWYWKTIFRGLGWLALVLAIGFAIALLVSDGTSSGAIDRLGAWAGVAALVALLSTLVAFTALLILFAPPVLSSIRQVKCYEPGDAGWGVKLDDVRGQAEAKLEIERVVSLSQSGGEDERGVLFVGPPGTGKTMVAKAIATSLDCPLVTVPGAGLLPLGMDTLMVRKARRLAAKWGGRCIVLIDAIDAVGPRDGSPGSGFEPLRTGTIHDALFFGERGALTWDGDLLKETRAWRDRIFALRAEPKPHRPPPAFAAVRDFAVPGGSRALNRLLVVLDGVDEPALLRQLVTRTLNAFLDAMYVVPQRVFGKRLRLRAPGPRAERIHFIGASDVPPQYLDPALTRPGRLARHIHFRTPTWEDRRDVFDLYLRKVAHDGALDTPRARDELARITSGYSPAMIDRLCSLALAHAHADGRPVLSRQDLLEAMVSVEAGVATGRPAPEHEERATAIHEAGHAVCAHLYMENGMSTRLSVRRRGHTGGQHQMAEIEDRAGHWRSEEVADLIWGLGALAAEHVFYDQSSTGVGGDLGSVTHHSAHMVSLYGMAPAPIDLADRIADRDEREQEHERVMERFETLGYQLMHGSGGMDSAYDSHKRRLVAGLIGQSFVIAWNTIRHNREGTEHIAERLLEAGELYGDDVVALLESARLHKPAIDVLDENAWPTI